MADLEGMEAAFLYVAKREALAQNTTPAEILMQIMRGAFRIVSAGRILVSTSEAGGTASFAIPEGAGQAEVLAIAARCYSWLEQQPDPLNPNVSAKAKRSNVLHFTFNRAPN